MNTASLNCSSLAAWCVALFLAATLFSHTVALRLTLLAAGALFCAMSIVAQRSSLHALPPIWLAFLLWAAWSVASLAWSIEPDRSEKELRNEVVYTGLALWTCYVAAQARGAVRIIVPFIAAAAVLLCGLALYHFRQSIESYATGVHGGPGNLSSALITLLPCILAIAWYGWRTGSRGIAVIGAAIAGLGLVAAYTTLNRTIWVAFAAELLIFSALAVCRLGIHHRRSRRVVIALAIGLVAASAFATLRIQVERKAIGGVEMSHDPRLALWPEVIGYIKERPLTGYGFGRGLLRKPLGEEFKDELLWHAHNFFLDTTLQLGVPGLLLLALLLAATLRAGWRLAREPDELAGACGMALLAALAGMVIRNSTDTLLVRQNALLYWGVVGVLLAWGQQARKRPDAGTGN